MFRSYKPVTDTLQESVLPEAAPGEVADHVREELENEHRGVEIEQLDFTNLVRERLSFRKSFYLGQPMICRKNR